MQLIFYRFFMAFFNVNFVNHADFNRLDMDGRICVAVPILLDFFSASFFCWTSKNSFSF